MPNNNKQSLKEELQKMYKTYCKKSSNEDVWETYPNSNEVYCNDFIYPTDEELDDYYAGMDEDDRDCSYYENAYGNLIDLAERQAERLEDEAYEAEEFYSLQTLYEPIETELQKAKKYRAHKKYKEAIDLCNNLLQKNPNNRYALNLKIATLGDMGSPEAYKLAMSHIEKYAWQSDYILTMFGLLQKMRRRKNDFVKSLNKYCPVCLEVYVENLGKDSPKRKYLIEMMKTESAS